MDSFHRPDISVDRKPPLDNSPVNRSLNFATLTEAQPTLQLISLKFSSDRTFRKEEHFLVAP
jgi:hypothetical protein